MSLAHHAHRMIWIASLLSNGLVLEAFVFNLRRTWLRRSHVACKSLLLSSNPAHGSVTVGGELPLDIPRRDDVQVALEAVRKACQVAESLQPLQSDDVQTWAVGTISKPDTSPVTVADFAIQGLILHILNGNYPSDGFIAEEDSSILQGDERLCQQVANAASLDPATLIQSIDIGKSYQQWDDKDGKQPSRVWVLDPIDGTRGFLRGKLAGGQYAIALALLQNGVPVVGVLGCPNLPTHVDDENYAWTKPIGNGDSSELGKRGCIFVASRGGGCYQLPLTNDGSGEIPPRRLRVTQDSCSLVEDARFCIGVERYSDALGHCAGMAEVLHGGKDRALNEEGEIVRARRMDSQVKHGVIARGGAELYARLPKPGYVEWIWDHAAGNVVIEEAGGEMSDVEGQPIDFSLGAQLSPDVRGVLMSSGGAFHRALVKAYASVDATRAQ